MTGDQTVGLVLLLVGGFLIGGVVSLWPRNRIGGAIVAVLAVLALAGAALRLLPGV